MKFKNLKHDYQNRNDTVFYAINCLESILPIWEEKFSDYETFFRIFSYVKAIPDFTNLNDEQKETLAEMKKIAVKLSLALAYMVHAAECVHKDTRLSGYDPVYKAAQDCTREVSFIYWSNKFIKKPEIL